MKTGKPSNSTDPKDYTYEFTLDTWVHIDCRESFGINGKIDALCCKTENDLKGTSGNLVSTSDNASFENMKDCEYKAETETATSRLDTLWLGTVKDTSGHQIKHRRTSTTSIGWIYINQICKYEKYE